MASCSTEKDDRIKMRDSKTQLLQAYQGYICEQNKALQQELDDTRQTLLTMQTQLEQEKARTQHHKHQLKQIQSQLYESTKPIRVTDDDFSTIISNLGKLAGKINHLPPNVKSAFTKANHSHAAVTDFFCKLFPNQSAKIQHLFLINEKLDYALISVLVERYLTETMVRRVLQAGIHLDQAGNQAHQHIYDLFTKTNHAQWQQELRLKMAKATAELLHRKDEHITQAVTNTKHALIDEMVETLDFLYPNYQDTMRQRIEKLVDMAADLCLPMHGQEDIICVFDLNSSDNIKVMEAQLKRVYRHLEPEGQEIYLGIAPVFLAKSTTDIEEDDQVAPVETYIENYTLVFPGKAIW
jgi:hypothetical protein